jgi:4-alpha-glucanotransferase
MSALDRLAEKMGIEPEFSNAAGERQRTTPEIKRGLLGAMRLEIENEHDAEAALAKLEQTESSQPLPPIVVVRKSRLPAVIPVTLPGGTGTVRWSVREEGGGTHGGSAPFRDLELVVSIAGRERRRLVVDTKMPLGYHRLRVESDGSGAHEMPLVVVPERCYIPEGLTGDQSLWGISVQLYLLRSEANWGIGDYTDLKRLVEIAADFGAAVVGLNPLHAMFLDNPAQASPYSPASRLFLNVLCIDVCAVFGYEEVRNEIETSAFKRDLKACRDTPLVDYDAVARLKLPVLERLFMTFQARTDQDNRAAFAEFRDTQGEALERFCVFQALRQHFAKQSPEQADWRRWPEDFQKPDSPAVARFAEEHREHIDFLAWTQWIADQQLAAAAETARKMGMVIGLYRDLAVGADSAGAETWATPDVVISSAHVGAPPDLFNPAGQDWGLPPFNPHALRREAYTGFVQLVRANMRHAGGLRIDHVMALQHLYWIPEGKSPKQGAYISYPLDDLIGVLALESQRSRCIVVGEDLGTVPEGFRERMSEADMLSYRVVFFEFRDDGSFKGPEEYPRLALSTIGSHDLATLRGWWEGRDIALKEEKGLYPDEGEAQKQRDRRVQDRNALLAALRKARVVLPADFNSNSPYGPELSNAVHEFLARTQSGLAIAQLDDLADEADQVNLPATTDQYPNWRRKQSVSIEQLASDARVAALAGILRQARPSRSRLTTR